MERLLAKNPLNPLLSMGLSFTTLIFGLITAQNENILFFYIGIYVLYICFGYYKACLIVIPTLVFTLLLLGGLTFFISENPITSTYAINRGLAISLSVIPGLSFRIADFIRNLRQIKVPKIITLGMLIVLNYVPLLAKEMKQIKDAIKTRGAGSLFNARVFYRSLVVPLIMRIVQISDTLSLSIETRGFTIDKTETTIFEPLPFTGRDTTFLILFVVCMVGGAIL